MLNRFSTLRVMPVILFAVFIASVCPVSSKAQSTEPDSLGWYWHRAFFAEVRNEPKEVIYAYDRIRSLCETLPIDIREWFKGTAFFGTARAKAQLHDKEGTRDAIAKALSRHFWNFGMIQSLQILDSACGKQWIDSICTYWSDIRNKEIPFWHPQPTLLLKPKYIKPNVKYPLLIVLQGGNDCYERLVARLNILADSLGLILVFPAAVHRLSEVTNSWDGDTSAADAKISAIIKELSTDPAVDTNNISLFGYSQGSQVSYDYAFSHPSQIRNVITFSGFAPAVVQQAELRNAAVSQIKIIAISGSSDSPEFLRSSRQLQQEALEQGLSFELRVEPDLPHGLPIDAIGYFTNIWRQLASTSGHYTPLPPLATPNGHFNSHSPGQEPTGK